MRRLLHAHRLVVRGFGLALPFLNWSFLLCGLAGAVGTAAGLLPPFSHNWWAKVTSILLWLLFAREGYEPLAEDAA